MGARFKQVDVFTERPFLGNPVAVVLDAEGLDDAAMQRIAAWMNLSETTFVLPSERADYRVRIFTPRGELPFAGHPTLGTAHAVLEAGIAAPRDGALMQECVAGLIRLRVGESGITARVPTPKVIRELAVQPDEIARALRSPLSEGAPPLAVDLGPVWVIARLESVAALAALEPDFAAVEALSRAMGVTGITAFAIDGSPRAEARVQLRSFLPASGILEDPVCGSCNAAVGAYLGATGLLARTGSTYVAAQGAALGRDGRVTVEVRAREVSIGGRAVTVIDGEMRV
jgi:PhzF family phenazine biosynthesis protein